MKCITIAVFAALLLSGCVSQELPRKTSADFIPEITDFTQPWALTESSSVSLQADGFVDGTKIRLARKEGIGRIIARITVYTFDSAGNSTKFHDLSMNSQMSNNYTRIELGMGGCYADQRTGPDLEITGVLCRSSYVFYDVEVVGVKYGETETDAKEISAVIGSKIASAQSSASSGLF